MIKRILVPLDGSMVAEQAIATAGRLAHATSGTVVLLRVVPLPSDDNYGASFLYSASTELNPGIHVVRISALQYLKNVAASSTLVRISTEMVTTIGQAPAMIVAVAGSRNIDLIVMGSHNNTELLQRVLGSGAQVVTRHAPVPVLVLRQRTPTHGSFACDDHPLRMLVLLDGSVLAEAVLKPAAHLLATLATPGQAAMHLLQVVKRATSPDMTEDAYPLQQAQAYLASIADTLQKSVVAERKPVITWAAIRDTDIAHAIIETAEGGVGLKGAGTSAGYDLIAMATHGRLGLQFLERGSVAERLLAGTNLPVFIVRAEPITNERATVREAGERRCDQVFG